MQDQTRGIDWVNIIVGTDLNGDEGSRSAPKYFAEIHLVIPLTETQKEDLEKAQGNVASIKGLLKQALQEPGKIGKEKLVDALELKK